jgi:pimeloyl-ACP methyl ester carboxylesterase
MSAEIRWRGAGEPVLFFPGWNTDAATVLSWMPKPFLARFRCGVVEWPGLGGASGAALPEDLEGFLAHIPEALPHRPVPVVGFCLGGVAAWAFARLHPARVRCSVLVDSPLHFPAVLSPLLVPGLSRAAMYLAQGTRLGRRLVSRAVLQGGVSYPQSFLDGLFAFDRGAAIHYLHLFRRYAAALREPLTCHPPCWRLVGWAPVSVMAPALGRRHEIEARVLRLKSGGHFPAVEAPEHFFGCLAELLAS